AAQFRRDGPNSGIGSLPRVFDGKTHVWPWVACARGLTKWRAGEYAGKITITSRRAPSPRLRIGDTLSRGKIALAKRRCPPIPAAMKFATPLPIDAVLEELRTALAARASAVLVAPPGAGKTTRVPLALMEESWLQGRKILVLEPRRIAARAAAERMAHSLSEGVGKQIGLRARMVSRTGPSTRVEVVTEGVFTRIILDDPELSDIGAVL